MNHLPLYIPSNTIKERNGKVGINIRKEMWDVKQLDGKYEKLTQIINLMESKEINFEKVGVSLLMMQKH